MEIKKGVPVSPGISINEAFILDSEDFRIPQRFIRPEEIDSEIERFDKALQLARKEIIDLHDQYSKQLGEEVKIFWAHYQMLGDKLFRQEVVRRVRDNRFTPEYAVSRALRKYIKVLSGAKEEYIRHRAADIYDIEKRLLRILLGEKREQIKSLRKEVILVAKDLTPSQTATLDSSLVKGFATDAGGRTSHTAIVARALGIPAVVGLGSITEEVSGGDTVIIDGTKGIIIIGPDESTLRDYRNREQRFIEFERTLVEIRDLPAETLDGFIIRLLGNIEFPHEIKVALANGAQGIGLYRTEFLFTEKRMEPDEESHFAAYKNAVDQMNGLPLAIRTLDLGADKFAQDLIGREMNPFLGCRSIRFCFQRLDLFKTQIRAILRASAFGNVKLMLPMISSLSEVKRARVIISDVMEELEEENIPFNPDIPVGVMIEVPSAALTADLLAREVDFFSIGTNDLVQYTLAVDRVNERVTDLYQPAHPAILRLLINVIEAGHRHNIEVSMCGEMSGDVMYTIALIGMGLRDLSISPAVIPEVKKVIRSVSLKDAAEVVDRIFAFSESKQTEIYLRERARKILPQLF